MATLLTVATGQEERSYEVSGTLMIGRAPDVNVQLESIKVSRHHASLVSAPNGLLFMDLGSANGSRVNGHDVEPRVPVVVKAGDTISIADCDLRLSDGGAGANTPRALSAGPGVTRVALPGSTPAGGPHATVMAVLLPHLEVVTRAGTRQVPLQGDEITVGREADNQICVDAEVVSRHHLVLRRRGAAYVAEDLGTTNGIRVGGERVDTHMLRDGDILDIAGEVSLRYSTSPVPAETVQEQDISLDAAKTTTIGRGEGCELRLTHPTVSLLHARVSPGPSGARVVEDLGSTNGTYVNGVRLAKDERRVLAPGDVVQVGPVRLHFSSQGVRREDHSENIRLTAVRLNQRVSNKLNLLQDISVVIEPQEFVAIVGVSGSGKSTLLGALSGLRPATDGDVLLNETSLYDHFEAFRTTLGYVPQDDILHRELPVGRALNYAAELRLPDDTSEAERHQRVESVISTLGLQERRETPVGRLSGGQRKRVSIGAELLTQPGLFFLDEATSGLDPGTESQLMRLLRRLADEGHTIALITHATKNVMLCDQVLFLARGGNLAYYGPPDQALGYFGVEDFDGIYEKLEAEKSPEEWAALYRGSRQYQEFIAERLSRQPGQAFPANAGTIATGKRGAPAAGRTSSAMHQFRVLSQRYFELIRRDRVNFALLFLLAPALSLIDIIAWPGNTLDRRVGDGGRAMTMFFLAGLIPFLVGSLSSVREIVKESAIYARERSVSLKIWPYLSSKIAIASVFALYHGAILFAAKALLIDYPGIGPGDYAAMYVTLVLAVISGVMWALLISTVTRREEQAMMLVIGVIVVQLVFSGGLVPISDLGPVGGVLAGLDSTSWTLKALTAASGISTAGCTGDLINCNLPGIQGFATPQERQLAFTNINQSFADIFGADILVCWGAMIGLIAALAVIIYWLQKRKDTL
jgi:ABC-type multidrug transport system ATPase subunit